MASIKRIHTQLQLQELAKKIRVSGDWHEPDNQNVDAICFGGCFDNAGHWGLRFMHDRNYDAHTRFEHPSQLGGDAAFLNAERFVEMFVVLYKDDNAVAEINLATLFAFACGTYAG